MIENRRESLFVKHTLDNKLTKEQKAFFDKYGFIHFKNFLTKEELNKCLQEIKNVEQIWIKEKKIKLYGTPIFWGKDFNGKKVAHRMPHTSVYSKYLSDIVTSETIGNLAYELVPEGRIGERETDGLVVNQYYYSKYSNMKRMGWHTDSIRYPFYLQKFKPMLNIGIHLTLSRKEFGGLRIIPGSHKQSNFSLLTKKVYYLDCREDKNEICIETDAGDLTVHDGRLWHRVARSTVEGEKSRRIVMYVPFICGPKKIKTENSPVPFYHRFQSVLKI